MAADMSSTQSAELEIHLESYDRAYRIEMKLSHIISDETYLLFPSGPLDGTAIVTFDSQTLAMLFDRPDEYGAELGRMLFEDALVLGAYQRAREIALRHHCSLYICLYLPPADAELHALHWELLLVPGPVGPNGHSPVRVQVAAQSLDEYSTPLPTPVTAGLTGAQIKRVIDAIQAAYTYDGLRVVITTCLNEDLDSLVPVNKAYPYQLFELVRWANRQGRIAEMVKCLHEGNLGNTKLADVYVSLFASNALTDSSSAADLRALDLMNHYIQSLSGANRTAALRDFRSLRQHKPPAKSFASEEWAVLETWHALITAPETVQVNQFYQAVEFDLEATCGALLACSESLRDHESYLSMAEAILGKFDDLTTGLRHALLTSVNKLKSRKLSSAQQRFILAWPLQPVDLKSYKLDPHRQSHVLSIKVCHYNPFKFMRAEDEFVHWHGGSLFWADHPCTLCLESSLQSSLIYGADGIGKTALARYLHRQYRLSADLQDAELCVYLSYLPNAETTLFLIADDILGFVARNVLSLVLGMPAEHLEVLVPFLVQYLGSEKVLCAISNPRWYSDHGTADDLGWMKTYYLAFEQHVSAAARVRRSEEFWFMHLEEIARTLGTKGCHLIIDNVTAADMVNNASTLTRLNGTRITLLTGEIDCAHNLEGVGFQPRKMTWDSEQLLTAACHRINSFCRRIRPYCPNLDLADLLPGDLIAEDAWVALVARAEHRPRKVFRTLSHIIEQSTDITLPLDSACIANALSTMT